MEKILLIQLIILISVLKFSSTARILASIFIPSFSHHLPFRPIWKELANRGHEITVITTDPMNDPNLKNIREIDLSGSYAILENKNTSGVFAKERANTYRYYREALNYLNSIDETIDWQFSQPDIKDLIKNGKDHFDILIVEIMNPMHMAFAER